jgi:iron(III) transport system substrate-binding protein
LPGASGCISSGNTQEVVAYVALDREFSEPILQEFSATSGVTVLPKYDVESTKTVGLTQALIAEANRPRCDVFWNNEILNTLRLEERGLLAVYRSPVAESYPEMYRSPSGTWHGFAGRARVLLVNTDLVADAERPDSIQDMLDSKWRGKIAIAKPLFGTTATHCACLFALWGNDVAQKFFLDLLANDVQILAGNKQVALSVSAGQVAWGLTDTDDAIIEVERGQPVTIIYPDREPDQIGTLFIPNTLCILKNSPHAENARKLVDFLLAPAVESRLASGSSAQIPLNPAVTMAVRVETPRTVKSMQVEFSEAARQWDAAAVFIRDHFAR